MSEISWDDDDQRWADVAHIAAAVKQYMKNQAYLLTGGSDGCALCKDRTLEESLAAGHRDCGVTKIRWDAAHELFATSPRSSPNCPATCSGETEIQRVREWAGEWLG